MDRTLRNKKSKSRIARTYDRPNQSLLGKVASKVKGILYPSWLSTWMGSGEDQGSSNRSLEEESADEEEVPQPSARPSKRPRLRLHEDSPPILSAGTQTWIDGPSTSNIFNQSRIPSTVTSSTLVQNKEPAVIMNGDDHSENSEESASTSGCSSLVSHKDRLSCLGSNLRPRESELANFRGQLRDVIGLNTRQSITSQNESLSVNVGSSRMSMWSGSGNCSPNTSLLSRSPSVVQRNQPGFNVSSFVGPKLNQSTDSRTSSPFYKGRTTFGGASALRRMPISVAPYQVEDKSIRSQVKVNSKEADSSLEGMSSAAKRILMTLEKMSSPVTDARRIPNTNKSPVDLSLYLMPPKHRGHVMSTPSGTSKGPPIANISTISKMATIRSCGVRRFQNSSMESIPVPAEDSTLNQSVQQDTTIFGTSKSGGGKMRSKLTQQHQSSAGVGASEELDYPPLPNVPLPISSLPTFSFGPSLSQDNTKKTDNDFEFSNPIIPAQVNPSSFGKTSENSGFTFSTPIELESPFTIPSAASSSNILPQTWECSSCWVRNPAKEQRCLACETPKNSKGSDSSLPMTTPAPSAASASSMWKCNSCWIQNPASASKCQACEEPKPGSTSDASTVKSSASGFGSAFAVPSTTWKCDSCWISNPLEQAKCLACEAPKPGGTNSSATLSASSLAKSKVANPSSSTWECGVCWIQNPPEKDKCMACEAPNPSCKDSSAGSSSNAPNATSSSSTPSPFLNAVGGVFSSTPASGFKMPSPKNGPEAVSFGGFKIPTAKPSVSEEAKDKSSDAKDSELDQGSKVAASKRSSRSTFKFTEDFDSENGSETSSNVNGPNNLSSTSQKSSEHLLDSTKEKSNGTFSFKSGVTQSPLSAFNTKANSGFTSSGGWECDTCLVRVSGNAQICPACETHRPTKKNSSGLKDPGVFKFSSPIQNSPITFKFGAPSATSSVSAATTASSSFTFSTPSSTNSPFTSAPSSSIQKSLSQAESKSMAPEVPASKLPVPEFKFDSPKLPSTDAMKTIIPVINLEDKTESSSSDTKEQSDLKPVSQGTTPSGVTFAFGDSKKVDTTSSIASTVTFSTPSETALPKLPSSQATTTSGNPLLTAQDVKKLTGSDTAAGQSSFLSGGFNFKAPSTSASISSLFSKPAAETAPDNQLQAAPKVSEAVEDKKSISPFGLSSSTPSLASPFGQTLTGSTPSFNIRESATPKTSTDPPTLTKSSFMMSTTTSSMPTFSFGGSSTTLPTSSSASMPTASGLLSFQPTVSKSEDVKATAPTLALSTTVTPNAFTFGNPVATSQPSASAGFSFFSSAASTATTANSGAFTFGSTASQASKPGGFTFKSTTEEKPNPVSSNSISFGVTPTTTTASSAVFKFGASTPASTGGFMFGAVKSEPATTASSGFQFGSGSSTTNQSAFSGFQPTQPAAATAPMFQFGTQPASNPAPAMQFGANTFAFGAQAKTEAPSLMPQQPASAAAPASGFGAGAMQPMFGSTPAAGGFGKAEKTGFNFAAASGSAPVFQFGGSVEKKPATQFAFGATSSQEAAAPSNSFASPFNMSGTPSFNFGSAPSAGAQPFQFAASTTETASGAAPRKIRKALRRVPNRH